MARDLESAADQHVASGGIGPPVFRGTRVPVQVLFDYLEGGETVEDFLEGFPTVSRESAVTALEEAKQLLLARP